MSSTNLYNTITYTHFLKLDFFLLHSFLFFIVSSSFLCLSVLNDSLAVALSFVMPREPFPPSLHLHSAYKPNEAAVEHQNKRQQVVILCQWMKKKTKSITSLWRRSLSFLNQCFYFWRRFLQRGRTAVYNSLHHHHHEMLLIKMYTSSAAAYMHDRGTLCALSSVCFFFFSKLNTYDIL